MSSGNTVLSAWSFGLAAAAYGLFALHLLQQTRWRLSAQPVARLLLAAVAASALWALCGLADRFSSTVFFLRLGDGFDLLAYACWIGLLLVLLKPADRPADAPADAGGMRWLAPAMALGLSICVLLQVAATFGLGGLEADSRSALLGWMVLPVLALVLLEQLLRNVEDDARWNIKPLCMGLGGIFLFDLYLFSHAVLFNSADADAAAIRGAVHALMVPLLLLFTVRRRDWGASLRMSRQAAFHSATLVLAGGYLVFIAAVGYYVRFFGGEWGRALQLGLVFAALVALTTLTLSGSVRAKLRVLLGKHFFTYRYDYREEWLRFTRTLSAQASPQQMGQQVIRGLADMLESPAGGLWIKEAGAGAYVQTARWNQPRCADPEDAASALCRFMQRSGWVINLDEYRSVPGRYEHLSLPKWLLDLPRAWLIVPLSVGDELIGFVVLDSSRADMDVNWEVNDLLKTAGRQAAGFLAQMQATEALLEVRKFDAFNRMSAFVVHDLKNIVTQLSLMLKNAKRLHANPEFQQDMLMTIENSLDKMRQLMLQLREGATPPGTAFGVDLAAVAQHIEKSVSGRGRQLEVTVHDKVYARGHEERLERVIGHLVQNALDATAEDGQVRIGIGRHAGSARVLVTDTGHGMSQEFIRDRLFKPFQSTKSSGMGIGAYESFQYVRELGGSIQVRSEPEVGTEVCLLLPLFEAQTEPALEMLKSP